MAKKRMYYTRQPPTYDVVIEPVDPRDNEVGEGTGDEAQQSTNENVQEINTIVLNENILPSSNEGSNEGNNVPVTTCGSSCKPTQLAS
jgi:hypothetical protein